MSEYIVVIPARFASARLPGKPLRMLSGKTMLEHVYERGTESAASAVVIATDDARIEAAAIAFGADVCMTAADHQSGTDRLAEVARLRGWSDEQIIVNLQGDEPMMPAALVNHCAVLLDDQNADISTLASPLASHEDYRNPNVVKVVTDAGGYALYFSRAPIPHARSVGDQDLALASALHHHGIYGYRNETLQRIVSNPPSALEKCEQLEQLRALNMGMTIKVGIPSQRPGPGIDTEEDLAAAQNWLLQK